VSVNLSFDKPRVYVGVRVPIDKLTFVERKPPAKTSNPFTAPEPVFDAGEILERIAEVKEENPKRLDHDIRRQLQRLANRVTPITRTFCLRRHLGLVEAA
jgi:hypothetical protein